MTMNWCGGVCISASMLISGCAGIPQLYKPSSTGNPKTDIAPKIEHIVERITCELAGVSALQLKDRNYVITVLLTLQVNDEINLTPSLSFIEPLKTAGTNRTSVENLGIGGARERSFSSTFYFESEKLKDQPGCKDDPRKLYKLDGYLGLAEIARDGIGIGDQQLRFNRSAPPSNPSFGSSIKFVVTRAVNALGPTWSLLTFKGPSGANGLLNGKALATDTLNIAFAAQRDAKPSPEVLLQIELQKKIITLLEAREVEASRSVLQKRKELEDQRNKASFLGGRSDADDKKIRVIIQRSEVEVAQAEAIRNRAATERARSEIDLQAALEAANSATVRSRADAIRTGEGLINLQILQNLNVQPR